MERDLEDARLVGEFARAELSLEAGQSLTIDQPWLDAEFARHDVSRTIVYDRKRHGDSPIELLTVSGDAPARATALPPGSVRIYAGAQPGGEFIGQTSIGYTAAGEPLELTRGPAAGVSVTRTLDEATEVDTRKDARNKVVLFDLLETWVLEVRNLRPEPVDLLIREHHEGVWTLEQSTETAERVDAETLELAVTVEPDDTREITYRLRHRNRQP
jgi:hypothetical protein